MSFARHFPGRQPFQAGISALGARADEARRRRNKTMFVMIERLQPASITVWNVLERSGRSGVKLNKGSVFAELGRGASAPCERRVASTSISVPLSVIDVFFFFLRIIGINWNK